MFATVPPLELVIILTMYFSSPLESVLAGDDYRRNAADFLLVDPVDVKLIGETVI